MMSTRRNDTAIEEQRDGVVNAGGGFSLGLRGV